MESTQILSFHMGGVMVFMRYEVMDYGVMNYRALHGTGIHCMLAFVLIFFTP